MGWGGEGVGWGECWVVAWGVGEGGRSWRGKQPSIPHLPCSNPHNIPLSPQTTPHPTPTPTPTHPPTHPGDYWPGEADNLLASLGEEARQGGAGVPPFGSALTSLSKSRGKPIKGKRLGPGTGSTDEEVLQRLGDTIQVGRASLAVCVCGGGLQRGVHFPPSHCARPFPPFLPAPHPPRTLTPPHPTPTHPAKEDIPLHLPTSPPTHTPPTEQGMKEDFIVVHLRESCSCCRRYISGEMRYFHPSPPQKVRVGPGWVGGWVGLVF